METIRNKLIKTSELVYGANKNLVWILHIIIGLFFVAVAAVYLTYMDKDEKDVPFDLKTVNKAVYLIILILGSIMFFYHGHLFILDKTNPLEIPDNNFA